MKDEVQAADIAIVNQEVIIGGEELGVSGYQALMHLTRWRMHWQKPDLMSFCMEQIMRWIRGKRNYELPFKLGEKYPDIKILGINKSQDAQDSVTVLEQNGIKLQY